ncbi:LPXTG-motif cell wall-anchored protein [Lactobacillus colini]|uniref:LPXTG-motif cell wall-anchored protein n=1 Tax=Lactobacillus colini TaxID=1819254 RepID=A0ABS4MGQ5_9LACO|nr:LEA family epithelial adhesin [Lactobacillus colini]MBP2058865.1 LPXTG-motif cell wall-anchored protein [Lactobacillus colini]
MDKKVNELKRVPRFSLRKLNTGMASVVLGFAIFGINLAANDSSVHASTVETNNSSSSNQVATAEPTETKVANKDTNTLEVNNLASQTQNGGVESTSSQTDSATTQQLTESKAATTSSTDSETPSGATVDDSYLNTQDSETNKNLANEHALSSSDSYSSNIYQGKDGKWYKVVTINGNNAVYQPADIRASSVYNNYADDVDANIHMSKEDLGNGKVHWTITFFPYHGLTSDNGNGDLKGLQNANFGLAISRDYTIDGDVKVTINTDLNKSAVFEAHDIMVKSQESVTQSFNPKTDVNSNTGLINSATMPGNLTNDYIQGPYYFTTDTGIGSENLYREFFQDINDGGVDAEGRQFVGGGTNPAHQLKSSLNQVRMHDYETAVQGGVDKYNQYLFYDKKDNNTLKDGVINTGIFDKALILKSWGTTSLAQYSSYTVEFDTQHNDNTEANLQKGSLGQQFSGVAATVYSYQNAHNNKFTRALGEQRTLNKKAGVFTPATPEEVIDNWKRLDDTLDQLNKDHLNDNQLNNIRQAVHNSDGTTDTLNNIVKAGNELNDAMTKLGQGLGLDNLSDDPSTATNENAPVNVKKSDKYTYASPEKKQAYDEAVANAEKVFTKTGENANIDQVTKLTDAVNQARAALDGELETKAVNPATVKQGESLPDPASLVEFIDENGNKVDTPADATVAWEKQPDTSKLGPQTGTVSVTHNGKTTSIPVTVNVVALPDKKTPVSDTNKLTDTEKAAVENGVKKANPDATNVTVDDQGNATLTFNDPNTGKTSTSTISASDLVSQKTDAEKNPVNDPEKVKVDDPTKLTDTEKNQVKTNVEKANPSATDVTVDDQGNATLTYGDGSTNNLTSDKTVQAKTDSEKNPANDPEKVKVADPTKLTDKEKDQVKTNVEKSNPSATDVTVDDQGNATLTYGDGSTNNLTSDKTVQAKTDSEKNPANDPEKVKVADPTKLTDKEKDQVKTNVEAANPSATDVTVDDQGNATLTYGDGSTNNLTSDKTVQAKTDAEKDPAVAPSTKTPVADPTKLTDEEKTAVENNVKASNPNATDVTVDDKGNATLTYGDGSTNTLDPSQTIVQKESDAEKNPAVAPTTKVPVSDTNKLTDTEKSKVENNVKAANPNATTVTVDDKGNATLTYGDGSTNTLSSNKTVESKPTESKTDAESNPAVAPGTKVQVSDPSKLTETEKSEVEKNVKESNPSATTVTVDDKGNATLTYGDGSTNTLSSDKTVESKSAEAKTDAESNPAVAPGTKVQVSDPSKLTDTEKSEVENNVKAANPNATKVTVDDKGNATLTYDDGSTNTLSSDKTVESKSAEAKTDAESNPAVAPTTKVSVEDTNKLTDTEKGEVANNVKEANPNATNVTVDDKGNATLTYGDGSTNILSSDKTVEAKSTDTKTDAESNPAVAPTTKVSVEDTNKLTDTEKDEVADNVKAANPNATNVTVDDKGNATLTYGDGSTNTLSSDKTVEAKTDAENNPAVAPGTKVQVNDPSKLTDTEKSEVENNVKAANPSATNVTVDDKGNAILAYSDGSTNKLGHDKLVVSKTSADTKTTDATKIMTSTNQTDNTNNSDNGYTSSTPSSAKTLPQTGSKNNIFAILSGAVMIIMSLFGLGTTKRKKED